jgi:hypothetical protein
MPSAHYLSLVRRVRKLDERLLPQTLSPTGRYTEQQIDFVRAYRHLVHAEIEAYLEGMVAGAAQKCAQKFGSDGKPRKLVFSLIAFQAEKNDVNLTDNRFRDLYNDRRDHVAYRVNTARTFIGESVQRNNGIRSRNVLRLLLPIGIQPTEIDPIWLGVCRE